MLTETVRQLAEERDLYSTIVRKTLDQYIPFKVDWEITFRCNLYCSHCYQTGPSSDRELTTEEIYSILDQLAALGCLYITFTGGEILLREDFFAIAQYARKREFAMRFFTNGTLIDEKIADAIKELSPLSVEISLYGMDPHIHEKITNVPGSYEKTMRAFHLLKERHVYTVVKSTIMHDNISEFEKIKNFAKNIMAPYIFSLTVVPKIDGTKEILKYRLDERQLHELFASQDWLMEGVTQGGVQRYDPLCAAGINSLYISPYGEVFPCMLLRESSVNVKDKSLKEIWESFYFKKIRDIQLEDLTMCSKCTKAPYCDRCAGLAWLETKDLYGHSLNDCRLAGVRYRALEIKEKDNERRKEVV